MHAEQAQGPQHVTLKHIHHARPENKAGHEKENREGPGQLKSLEVEGAGHLRPQHARRRAAQILQGYERLRGRSVHPSEHGVARRVFGQSIPRRKDFDADAGLHQVTVQVLFNQPAAHCHGARHRAAPVRSQGGGGGDNHRFAVKRHNPGNRPRRIAFWGEQPPRFKHSPKTGGKSGFLVGLVVVHPCEFHLPVHAAEGNQVHPEFFKVVVPQVFLDERGVFPAQKIVRVVPVGPVTRSGAHAIFRFGKIIGHNAVVGAQPLCFQILVAHPD